MSKTGPARETLLMSPLAGPRRNAHFLPPMEESFLFYVPSTPHLPHSKKL